MARPLSSASRLLTEFLVIVAGVSVGLLADDWRQQQEINREERRFLEDVLMDLEADSLELASVRDWYAGWDQGALQLRPWLDRPSIPRDTLLAHVSRIAGFITYEPTRAAYERMKASGRMNFLGDRALQAAVASYYETRQPYLQSVITNVGNQFGVGWVMTAIEWFMPEDVIGAGTHWIRDPDTGAPVWGLTVPWSELRNDPRLPDALDRVGFFGGNISGRFTEALDENRELRALIRAALETTS